MANNPHNTTANYGLFVAGPVSTEDAVDAGHAAMWDFDLNFLTIDLILASLQLQINNALTITSINGGSF